MSDVFSFMFYNTENFYDTVNDPLTLDDAFTPEGSARWTEKRFNDKVAKIAKVIREIRQPAFPDIIGLAEIENKTVLNHLLQELQTTGINEYQYLHYDSPDERGADVALLYNRTSFTVTGSTAHKVSLPEIEDRTRDILHVEGRLFDKIPLHLFLTHFPSRREGRDVSEPRRYFVAGELRDEVNKILEQRPDEPIVIMGDFNDTPEDNSVDEILGAEKEYTHIQKNHFYNLLYPRYQKGLGTTFHEKWVLYDQIIVSGNLLDSEIIYCKPEFADIYNPPYLLHFDANKRTRPNRTYRGKYTGGYSDHLPVYFYILLKK